MQHRYLCLWLAWGVAFGLASANAATTNSPKSEAELAIKKFQVAPGLKVELFAAEPLLQNPVSFTADERGRFFVVETHRYQHSVFDITEKKSWLLDDLSFRTVADRAAFLARTFATNRALLTNQSELIRLVEDRDGDGRAETSSVFADGFQEPTAGTAAGVLARKGTVWFACIPDLWRLRGMDGEGKAKTREKLFSGFGVHIGVTGHDLHGLRLGPDGKIYFSVGDRGFQVSADGKTFDYPDTGGVLRCNPDGSELEVFAIGLRNPQELAFDQFGNLWTADNDTAGEDKSRVIHVVEGGDYGWRCSYQHQAGFGPWVQEKVWLGNIDDVLPNAGSVAQGPSGLDFYPGTGLSDRFKNYFLLCDFPGGIYSFAVKASGASYEVADREKFLWNLWPTDVEFGRDGSVYVSDWVQGWSPPGKGRIYRVYDPGTVKNPAVQETKQLLADGMGKRSLPELASLLTHQDLRVRTEAQFALAEKGTRAIETLSDVTYYTDHQKARLHAIWALGQIGRKSAATLRPLLALLEDGDAEVRAQAAKMLGDCRHVKASAALIKLLPDRHPRVRFFAALSLGKLGEKEAGGPILEMLRANADEDAYVRHAGMMALLGLNDFKLILAAAQDESVAVRRAALLALRRLRSPEVASFLKDREPQRVVEAARAINDVPIPQAMPALALLLTNAVCPSNALSRAINANFRLGASDNAKALAQFAARGGAPENIRLEALAALADWESPGPLDRVMGLSRPLPDRRVQPVATALQKVMPDLLKAKSTNLQATAIRTAGKLKLTAFAPELLKMFQNEKSATTVRIEILQALAGWNDERMKEAVQIALTNSSRTVRREGIKWIERLNLADTAQQIEKMLSTESDVRLSQAALSTLGQLKGEPADAVLEQWLEKLLAGEVRSELRLDVLEAAGKRSSMDVKAALRRHEEARSPEDKLSAYREVLEGGDATIGRTIYNERADAACLRCHAIKGQGGVVGPPLDGIGAKQTREYLLEAILFPNKAIAPGYENVVVTLKNGKSHAGLVKSENDKELALESPEEGRVKIARSEIQSRQPGLSAMPEGVEKFLSKQDLRHLIEFLANLK